MTADKNKPAEPDIDSDDTEATTDARDAEIFELLGQPPAAGGSPQTGPAARRANDPNLGKP